MLIKPARILLGVVLGIAALPGAGLAAVNPKLDAHPMSAEAANLVNKAQQALQQGHPEVAVIYLKNAETAAPGVANIHLLLGRVLLVTNNPSEAERELNIALQKGVPGQEVLPGIFQALISQHENQMLLDRYPAPGPNDRSLMAIEILRARSIAQLQLGHKDEAAASLDNALTIARNAPNLTARAKLALDTGDIAQATKLTDEALGKTPNDYGALLLKAELLQRTGQATKALDYANTLVSVMHSRPTALLTRAGIYLQLNQDTKAASDVDAALAAAPNLVTALFYKSVLKFRAKDPKGAWAIAQTLPREFLSSRPDVAIMTSQMAVASGQHETGADILHSTVEKNPGNIGLRLRLSALYMMLKETDNAYKTLQPVMNSTDARVNALLSQIYAAQKKAPQSLDALRKANEGGYGGDPLKLQLANADVQRGKFDDAIQALEPLNAKQANRPEIVGPLIAAYIGKGDINNATKYAQALTKAAPNSPFGPYYEGQIATRKGDINGAIAANTMAINRDGKFAPAFFARANLLANKGDIPAAQSDLQKLLSINPKFSLASLRMAELYQRVGDDGNALAALKSAAAANPTDLLVYATLAHFYAARHKWPEASAAIATYLKKVPNDGSALTLQAEMELSTGAVDPAIKQLLKLHDAYPHSQDISLLLARGYAQKGDKKTAHDTLARAIADEPKSTKAHVAIVANDLSRNDNAAAVSDATAFTRDVPGAGSAQTLALVLARQGKGDEAIKVLQESLAAFPEPRTVIQLHAAMRATGKAKAADTVLASWLAQHPHDLAVRQLYGSSLMASNKPLAEQQMRQILADDPSNLVALNNLAWLLTEKDPGQANQFALRAMKIAPNAPSVMDTAGWIAWQLKPGPAALSLLERAQAGAPGDPEIAYHLSVVLAASKRGPEAKKILASTLANNKAFDDRAKAELLNAQLK
jgi:putative PEP-CTERM system TPR-repeat lipoprotein